MEVMYWLVRLIRFDGQSQDAGLSWNREAKATQLIPTVLNNGVHLSEQGEGERRQRPLLSVKLMTFRRVSEPVGILPSPVGSTLSKSFVAVRDYIRTAPATVAMLPPEYHLFREASPVLKHRSDGFLEDQATGMSFLESPLDTIAGELYVDH